MVMTKFIDCNTTSEYAFVDIHYDLQGRLIAPSYNGNTYYLKGQINNKYPITMQLSMQGDKIYGKYYYDKNGSDSCLHLYGGVSDSGDVVLLEFNNKGEQTGDFKGRFTSDSFYGTFVNYKGIEMPFELQKDNHNVVPQETTLKNTIILVLATMSYIHLLLAIYMNLKMGMVVDSLRIVIPV